MEHHSDDSTELHEMLQRLNNTYANGQPVRPPPSQAMPHTPEDSPPFHTSAGENGGDLQPDPVPPPPETQTSPDRDAHGTIPPTTPSENGVSPKPDHGIPPPGHHQDILGGSCPLLPIQCCIIWAARQEKEISPLALKVYFAAHEVKYWRSHGEPGETYHYEPYGFQPLDVGRLLPGVSATQITRAFRELDAANILTMSDHGVWFAESLDDVTLPERVTHRTQSMLGNSVQPLGLVH